VGKRYKDRLVVWEGGGVWKEQLTSMKKEKKLGLVKDIRCEAVLKKEGKGKKG